MLLNNTGTGDPTIQFQLSGTSKFTMGVDDSQTDQFKISLGPSLGSGDAFVIDPVGNIGIWNNVPNVRLDVIGSIEYTGNITDVSDARLKENIVAVENALEKIQAIDGVYFNMIDTPDRKDIGLIAQEVERVVPEVVHTTDDEVQTKAVEYQYLVGLLVEAMKEQQKQIEALENKINSLTLKENNRTSYGYTKTIMNK